MEVTASSCCMHPRLPPLRRSGPLVSLARRSAVHRSTDTLTGYRSAARCNTMSYRLKSLATHCTRRLLMHRPKAPTRAAPPPRATGRPVPTQFQPVPTCRVKQPSTHQALPPLNPSALPYLSLLQGHTRPQTCSGNGPGETRHGRPTRSATSLSIAPKRAPPIMSHVSCTP